MTETKSDVTVKRSTGDTAWLSSIDLTLLMIRTWWEQACFLRLVGLGLASKASSCPTVASHTFLRCAESLCDLHYNPTAGGGRSVRDLVLRHVVSLFTGGCCGGGRETLPPRQTPLNPDGLGSASDSVQWRNTSCAPLHQKSSRLMAPSPLSNLAHINHFATFLLLSLSLSLCLVFLLHPSLSSVSLHLRGQQSLQPIWHWLTGATRSWGEINSDKHFAWLLY